MNTPADRPDPGVANQSQPPRGLEQRILRRFRALGLPENALIASGFSGGIDSVCLAAALSRICRIGAFHVHLIHVDHGIREESARDAEHARELAAELGLPISVETLEPRLAARTAGIGLEEAARRERYLAFRDICRGIGADLVALAHHQQDQAESVLLHLVRGAGLTGAAAMGGLTELNVPWWTETDRTHLRVWRPFLDEPRSELTAYVSSAGLVPIEDATNADRTLLRNWLRHEMISKLETRRPGSSASLARFAIIAAEEDRFLDSLAESALSDALDPCGRLTWSHLGAVPIAIARRAVRRWLLQSIPGQELSFERLEAVLAFAQEGNPEKMLQPGGDAIVVWDRGTLLSGPIGDVFGRLQGSFAGPLAPDGFTSAELQSSVGFNVDGWRITARGQGSLHLRTARRGDRFSGTNLPVREWARRLGVHPLLRPRLLIAAADDRPVWAAGLEVERQTFCSPGWNFELTKIEGAG